ncbi:MAG TPA: Mut7-C RNAse domain-containing protein [Thermoanaerobaculia bacterium]|nr:Mut7-C RNAse domain-containing protein [Thermoanaerobaculia bacterium]
MPDTDAPRFVADAMLGALARWLRVLGLDTAYDPGLDDGEIVALSLAEGRTILTRDRRLVERRLAANHLLVASEVVDEQVRQVVAACNLTPEAERLFLRCLRCNEALVPADAEEARARVPPFVARTTQEFRRCPACGRFYWRASHVRRMRDRLRRMGVV